MKKLLYSLYFLSFSIQAEELQVKNTYTLIKELAHDAAYDLHTQTWNLPVNASLLERFKKGLQNIVLARKFESILLKEVAKKSGMNVALLKKNFFHAYKKNYLKKETIK